MKFGEIMRFFINGSLVVLKNELICAKPKLNHMSDVLQSSDFTGNKQQLPSGLNVLTILTFIGSGIGILGGLWQFISAKKSIESMEQMINSDKLDEMPGFLKGMMSPEALELARKQYENRVPILLIGMLGIGLCIYGAVQMRKLKKQGYSVYLIGQALPLIAAFIFLGFGWVKGFGLLGLFFPILFIILYTLQRKHLTN
jgi:hypothetical protein